MPRHNDETGDDILPLSERMEEGDQLPYSWEAVRSLKAD